MRRLARCHQKHFSTPSRQSDRHCAVLRLDICYANCAPEDTGAVAFVASGKSQSRRHGTERTIRHKARRSNSHPCLVCLIFSAVQAKASGVAAACWDRKLVQRRHSWRWICRTSDRSKPLRLLLLSPCQWTLVKTWSLFRLSCFPTTFWSIFKGSRSRKCEEFELCEIC